MRAIPMVFYGYTRRFRCFLTNIEECADALRLENEATSIAVRFDAVVDAGIGENLLERQRIL